MTATHADRMAAARQALERAEAAAGLRTRLAAPLRLAEQSDALPILTEAADTAAADTAADGVARSGGASPAPGPALSPAPGSHPGADPAAGSVTGGFQSDHLPVPSALAGFFPTAGLRRGSVVQVGGSSSLLLALVAAAQAEGWVGLAALPDVGLQAAAEAGLALDRTLLVPRPGPEAASVVGALVDGVDVLAVGDCRALNARDRRLLSARLRSRGAVLLSTAHWPGADVVLRAGEARATGLGRGWGRVTGTELTVHGRARSGAAGRVRVSLGPAGLGAVAEELRHAAGTEGAAAAGPGWDTAAAAAGPGGDRPAAAAEPRGDRPAAAAGPGWDGAAARAGTGWDAVTTDAQRPAAVAGAGPDPDAAVTGPPAATGPTPAARPPLQAVS